MNEDGTFSINNQEKASTLNKHFCKSFTNENTTNVPKSPEEDRSTCNFDNIIITETCVLKKLTDLNKDKSMGPDEIPGVILKNTASSISKPLSIIFNKSISEGKLPSMWKTANVVPIFKKGEKSNPNNYRPISLTPICCKVLETILRDSIMSFLEDTNYLTEYQYGFRRGMSCTTQLLEVQNDLTIYLDENKSIDIIYFDFKKAFDTVPHNRLIYKIKNAGLSGNILNWISDFLKDRKQRVVIQSDMSDNDNVLSGVPQGSTLGPLLFLIFINDLPINLKSKCKMFADDTKIYNTSENHHELQEDINKLEIWSKKWLLNFNVDKCKVLHIGKNNPCHNYQLNGLLLNKVTEEKDIGVSFDSTLEFKKHVKNCTNEANKLVGLIKRNFTFFTRDSLRTIITSLIRSKLEFGNVVWSPIYKWQSSLIEKVQRRATKLLPCIKNYSYTERLKFLNLTTLKYRRLRGDLIQIYKIIYKHDKVDNSFIEFNDNNSTRNNYLKLKKNFTKNSIRSNFLTNRITNTWNKLSIPCKEARDINNFKNLIDNELCRLRFDFDN